MEPLLKPYIEYATGFVPKERIAYAIDNGKYGRIEITANSRGNIIEPNTYALWPLSYMMAIGVLL